VRSSEAAHSDAGATTGGPSTELTRRAALAIGLSGCATLVQGCGGGGGSGDAALTPPGAWNAGPLYLQVGNSATRDLAITLPSDVARGGTFAVSAAGTALPAGMTLSAAGILAVGRAKSATVDGVIFTYTEPIG